MIKEYFTSFNLNSNQISLFEQYFNCLKDWNRKINLISFKSDEELWIKHFYDCAAVCDFVEFAEYKKVLDLGCGGGLPGIVHAILFPDLHFTLLDSVGKKIEVVKSIAADLNLRNVDFLTGRCEDLAQTDLYREKFDLITGRALAPLNVLLELSIPFLKKNGELIAYKGPSFKEELLTAETAIKILNVELKNVFEFDLPLNYGGRSVLIFNKLNKTPEKYPRKSGIPKKNPL